MKKAYLLQICFQYGDILLEESEHESETVPETEATSEQEAKTVIIEKHYYNKEEEKVEKMSPRALVQEDSEDREYKDRLVIRSYSSMILLIPSLITALVCGLVQMLMNRFTVIPLEERTQGSGYMNIIGIVFLIMFTLNLILVAFDFNRARTIIIIVLIIAVIAILLLVNAYTGFLSGAGDGGLPTMRVYFSSQVYFALALLLLFIILFTVLGSLVNYYVVEGNELLHHKGIGGGVERYPASDLSVVKEYPDIIEYLIFRSGTLILTPPRTNRAIVLKNVIGINKKEKQMNEILSRLKVDVD